MVMGGMPVIGDQVLQARQQSRRDPGAMPVQCLSSCSMQTIQCGRIELLGRTVQQGGEVIEFQFDSHDRSIPFAFKMAAIVCVAREQCVLTLPSVQPMAAAVSAVSNRSQ